jgi:DNA-binding beta-propeller fold protein YncE
MTTSQEINRIYRYDHTIGMDDFAGRSFRNLADLAIGPNEMLYVLQRGESVHHNVSVKKCNVDEEWFGDFGEYGTAPGHMVWPAGIAIDSQQRLYVTDEWNQRVSVFDTEGNLLDEWGEAGSGAGQFDRPSGIAFDAGENLLVVDARNHRVQRLTRNGRFLSQWGSSGTGPGQFNMPWGVALNASGQIYVTDWRNDRVQKFSPEGDFILEWGSSGRGAGEFNRPAGIAVDHDGDVYVVDWHNNRVQAFDSKGQYVDQLIGDASMSSWGGQLMAANPVMERYRQTAKHPEREGRLFRPRAVKVDHQNRIFIVDSCKGRLQVYRKDQANPPS